MRGAQSRRRSGAERRRTRSVRTVPSAEPPEPAPVEPSGWQAQALADLDDVVADFEEFTVEGEKSFDDGGICHVTVVVDTACFQRSSRAKVRFLQLERFTISIEPGDARPPYVSVDHLRFIGGAHVLSGFQICLYLDPSRQWDPADGIRGTFRRLRDWVADTAGNKHDPNTALYHAVGGTTHITAGTPTIVVRAPLSDIARPSRAYLHARTCDLPTADPAAYEPAAGDTEASDEADGAAGGSGGAAAEVCRYDLVSERVDDTDLVIPIVPLRGDLPIGAGSGELSELLERIEFCQGLRARYPYDTLHDRLVQDCPAITRPRHALPARVIVNALVKRSPLEHATWECDWRGHRRPTLPRAHEPAFEYPEPRDSVARLAGALIDAIACNPPGSPQYALVAVPHPAGGARHLICLRVPARIADQTRNALASPDAIVTAESLVRVSGRVPIEWCRVSDERDAVTTRRDVHRPVTELVGKSVHVWGTGGLGSWIAEWVVRAGAAKVVLCDPARVTGGLLVRQDFTENDIGRRKDEALALRLRSLRDDVEVEVLDELAEAHTVLDVDLLIDATINRAVTRFLDGLAAAFPERRTTFAQVATDTDTGTLGIAIVAVPGDGHTLTEIDRDAGEQVLAESSLEGYRVFWREPNPGSEFVPTRGCSVPTFHGSAADLAGVGGALLNLVCLHVASRQSGTHLMSLPHSEVTPARQLITPTPTAIATVPTPREPSDNERAADANAQAGSL